MPVRRDSPLATYHAPRAEVSDGKYGVLHGDVEHGTVTGTFPAHECRGDGGVEVDAAQDVAHGRTGLEGRLAVVTGDGHDAGHGLDGDVHGPVVAVRTRPAESRSGGIDEAWVDRGQGICADAVAVEGARREVLEQDVGMASQIAQ